MDELLGHTREVKQDLASEIKRYLAHNGSSGEEHPEMMTVSL